MNQQALENLPGHRLPGALHPDHFLLGRGLHVGEKRENGGTGGKNPLPHSGGLVKEGADPGGPGVGPGGESGFFDDGLEEVPADVGPAEGQDQSRDLPGGGLVGAVPVDHQDSGASGKVLKRDFGTAGGIQDEERRLGRQDHPEPPAGLGGLGPEDVVPGFVGLGKGGLPAFPDDRLMEGFQEGGDPFEPGGDRPEGQVEPPPVPVGQKPGEREMQEKLEEEDLDPDRHPQHAFGNEAGWRGGGHDPLPLRTGAGLAIAVPVDDPAMRSDLDLEDLADLGRAERGIGLVAGGTDRLVGRKVDRLAHRRKMVVAFPSDARNTLLMPPGTGGRRRSGLRALRTFSPFGLFAVKGLAKTTDLGLLIVNPVVGLLQKLPVVKGLVLPVGGVLFGRGGEIPHETGGVGTRSAGFGEKRQIRCHDLDVGSGRSREKKSRGVHGS